MVGCSTMRLCLLFFGFLPHYGAIAQVSKKPDIASSAFQSGEFQATTLLTSVINDADIVLHEIDSHNGQTELSANTDDLVDIDDSEVLTDTEEDDDNGLDEINEHNSGDSALGSTTSFQAGKGVRARLLRFKQTDCEKKRGIGKGKKMKEGKCHTLHRKHFQSYQFSVGNKKSTKKKNKDDEDDDYDDSTSKACRIIVYHDGKCKEEASTANKGSCEDMEDADDDDDEKKLHSRDLMAKPKGAKYRSAKFLCDGVDVSNSSSSTHSVSNHYTASSSRYSASKHASRTSDYSATLLSSKSVGGANATVMSSKSFSPSSGNSTLLSTPPPRYSKTASEEPTTTDPPDEDDDKEDSDEEPEDEEDFDEKDEEDEIDEEDHKSDLSRSQKTNTRKHKSKSHKETKGNKKHAKQTKNIVTTTQSVEAVVSA